MMEAYRVRDVLRYAQGEACGGCGDCRICAMLDEATTLADVSPVTVWLHRHTGEPELRALYSAAGRVSRALDEHEQPAPALRDALRAALRPFDLAATTLREHLADVREAGR